MSIYTAHTQIEPLSRPTKAPQRLQSTGIRELRANMSALQGHLSFSEELLQLLLRQQAVILDEGGHLWGTLHLVVHRPVDLHVAMQNCQEFFLTLTETHTGGKQNELKEES